MRRGLLVWLLCGLPALAAAQGGLPVVFDGGLQFRWTVPDDERATALLAEVTREITISEGRVTDFSLAVPDGAVLELIGTVAYIPEPLPGFGAVYGNVWPVVVDADGQRALETGTLEPGIGWLGIRKRFETLLLADIRADRIEIETSRANEPVIRFVPAQGQSELTFRLYAGPIERATLRDIDPVLTGMLFAALWDWLRWLCFGMLWLLTGIDSVVGNIGLSIILLSVVVKFLMTPLTRAADRLQVSVNQTTALIQPELAAIKREFKGEEAHNRVLAVYKKHGVHPLYTMKSLAGFLLQIPIFIAAFDMLGENIALHRVSFQWIEDLAEPDQWLALPFVLPFFGGYLNLLPVLMTGFTLLTSWLQHEESLNDALNRQQQLRLYWMAGAFFLLFYTFPAGMVLYWTTNNVLALARLGVRRILARPG